MLRDLGSDFQLFPCGSTQNENLPDELIRTTHGQTPVTKRTGFGIFFSRLVGFPPKQPNKQCLYPLSQSSA